MQQVRLEVDANVRRVSNGTALIGGSPFRVVRLSSAGAELLNRWLAGEPGPISQEAEQLRTQLIRGGMVHPVAPGVEPLPTVTFVVPVFEDIVGLEELLRSLRRDHPNEQIIVVDDASPNSIAIAAVSERYAAELLRHDQNRGPAAARNTGWRSVTACGDVTRRPSVIVFVDADVESRAGAVQRILGHFDDPGVAVVAPRVRARAGRSPLAAYESHNSPLDMGGDAAIVYPGTRISYVPSAMLAVRTEVLEQAGGFDEAMRYGEDVDMVWRIIHDGHLVRYEPGAVVEHRNRLSLAAFARQRFSYGSSAASLASRHGDKVSPLQLPVATVTTTLALLFGGRGLRSVGALAAVAGVIPLARKLTGKVDAPNEEALRLTAMTHKYAVNGLAVAATRSWGPLLLFSRRTRSALAAALIVPALVDWICARPALDPITHTAMRAIDHGSYCAGVWSGVLGSRSVAALLPSIRISARHDD
jgi:mycofactocin system glycosyltransferase